MDEFTLSRAANVRARSYYTGKERDRRVKERNRMVVTAPVVGRSNEGEVIVRIRGRNIKAQRLSDSGTVFGQTLTMLRSPDGSPAASWKITS